MTDHPCELSVDWLGLTLRSPLVVAACPISQHPDAAAIAADAGAGAIVMHSLFEEQLIEEQMSVHRFMDSHADIHPEAGSYLPDVRAQALDSAGYLAELVALTRRLDIPVVASLNGTTPGGWTRYAAQLADAGASALELNLYDVATGTRESGADVESRQLELIASVVASIAIPVAVKLTPFYASLPAFVQRLAAVGVRGVTVFNRFFEPSVDLETLEVRRTLVASTPADLPLRLHALALLSGQPGLSLACSGGVHSGEDAARALLCGADVVQVASCLMAHGPAFIGQLRQQLLAWLTVKGYTSASDARGVLNFARIPDPTVWTRMNYLRTLEGWRDQTAWRTGS